ncbi:uncharacterized protein HMPREF1541_02783 [Cyphellophora europaea CBS 101466]|uniref:WSC domain-containing protein n=1 Tax=Cyphellophora europaea (strain CBS 101466) TaxID=1220924 RepID=W2S6R0_CYPE1|nr:uncharacterized protein HMPREF1541_02783 [Cyphellophora europaea CBS 101466]ETN43624.1 hypothetical protein HMPREF1541_02783 [Cyphellophora europaea CBS 101466]
MSTSSCATFCLSKSLPVFGLEYGRECYCASSLAASARPLSPNTSDASSGCNMPCSGAATEVCGGNSRLSVYNNTLYSPPVHKATISGYAFQGCYTDIGPRTLQGYSFSNGNMSQELCVSTCAAKDFKVAGAEYAEQCFCGTEVLISADGKGGMKVQNGECAMPCKGDGSEWCGAGNRLSIWAM